MELIGRSRGQDDISDEALLSGLAVADDRSALVFVRRYEHRLFGLALAMVGEATRAEDVVQEAFVRIFRHAEVFDTRRGTVLTWALTITRNVAIDVLRVPRDAPADPQDQVFLGLVSARRTPEEAAVTADGLVRVRAALADLPTDQRRVVLLAAMYGRSATEIAERGGHTARDGEEPDPHGHDQAPGRAGGRRPMSDYLEGPAECHALEDDVPELALGTLSGRRRSEVLGHVGWCRPCRVDLEQLSIVADALVQLAPPVEPPAGFERRLTDRLRASPGHRLSWSRRPVPFWPAPSSGRGRIGPPGSA